MKKNSINLRPKKAELICTGSELVTVKNNSYIPLFAARLQALGFRLKREHSVGDNRNDIASAIKASFKSADLVIACGGLGPTFDDLTREAAALALGKKLVHSKSAAKFLKERYPAVSPEVLANQSLSVLGAKLVNNMCGTAFGQILKKANKVLVLLPGPKHEWEPMWDSCVADTVKKIFPCRLKAKYIRLKIAGLRESEAEQLLMPVTKNFPEAEFTILAGPGILEFHFTVYAPDKKTAAVLAGLIEKNCRKVLGKHIYGTGDETLPGLIGKILRSKKATIAVAESCTGGALGSALTDIQGASEYVLGGITAYSNKAKHKMLGVKTATLKKFGAVSPECAAEMADGALRAFNSAYAISITGIAGPGGGSKEKPVGLVYAGIAGSKIQTRVLRAELRGTRTLVKSCSVNFALDALRKIIE